MLLLNSSLRNRFGYQVSYVLSKAEGNVDNTGFGNWLQGVRRWNSPNTAIINTVRRADQLAAPRDQGVRVLPGAESGRHAGRRVLRAQRTAVHAVRAAHERASLNAADQRQEADLPRAARQPSGMTSSTRSTCGRRRRSGSSGHRFGVYRRHRQPVQHRDGDDAAGAVSEHDDLRRDGRLQGADRRPGRTAGHVRRPLDVLSCTQDRTALRRPPGAREPVPVPLPGISLSSPPA